MWQLVAASKVAAQPAPQPAPAPTAGAAGVAPEPMPVAFGADEVRFDARSRELEVAGHVHVDEPPFYLTSDGLTLRRVAVGVVLDGDGTVAFCPCLGTPLAVRFRGATVAPPHDLVLKGPVLEVFGVPVAWAPAFWLRSAARFGVLAPEVAWRGTDGLFLGEGVHVPWRNGDATRGLDLRAGAYAQGGAAVQVAMRTTQSMTHIQWDWLHTSGVGIDAHGATAIANGDRGDSVAWSVDALRGRRAVVATTDLDAAARPFDRADAQASWRADGWTFASGVRAVSLRGADMLEATTAGPVAAVHRADALAHAGTYDATIEGGAVSTAGPGAAGTTSFARAEGGAWLGTRLGAADGAVTLRALGDVTDDGTRSGVDGGAQARLVLGLPLARAFASEEANDPWVHRTEPRLQVGALAVHQSDVLAVPAGRGLVAPAGESWVASAGWSNAVGRWGTRASAEADVDCGAVGNLHSASPALRARAVANLPWLGLGADFARVLPPAAGTPGGGGALLARARLGPERGPSLAAHVAERDGVDPILARALVDAPLEPASGFLVTSGWTGGGRLAVPLGSRVTTRAGADFDLEARELVAALGAIELHDPCGCVVVRASAAHRIGRSGVDAWLTVDVAPH